MFLGAKHLATPLCPEESDIDSGVWATKDLAESSSEGGDVADLGDTIQGEEGDEQLVLADGHSSGHADAPSDGENPSHVEAALAVFQPEDIGPQNTKVFHLQLYILHINQFIFTRMYIILTPVFPSSYRH